MLECPRCAFRNAEADVFCGSCGLYLDWAEAPVGAAGATVDEPPSVPPPGRTRAAPAVAPIPSGRRGEEPVELPCRACGRANARTRRFCGRCGTSLSRLVDAASDVPPPAIVVIEPWWRRLMWWRRRRALRVFEAGARPGRRAERRRAQMPDVQGRAGPVRRALRWVRATLRRIWPDVILALIVLLVICLLIPGARRAAVEANPFRDEPPGFLSPLNCTEPREQGDSLAAYPPAFACDNKPATIWATAFDNKLIRDKHPRLWIDFAKPVDVREFHIAVGELTPAELLSSPTLQASGRPKHVCLRFYTTAPKRARDYRLGDRPPIAAVAAPRPAKDVSSAATPAAPTKPGAAAPTANPGTESTSAECRVFSPDSVIADDTEDHSFTFDTVKGVSAIGIEMRDVHPAGAGRKATNVYVSGVEFFGSPSEVPPPSAPPSPGPTAPPATPAPAAAAPPRSVGGAP